MGHKHCIGGLFKDINKAVAMKGLTLSLLHLHFGFGWKFYDRAKILGSGEKFMFRRKFWVWEEILGLGENFGFG